jgi:serine protease inhibitor
MAAAVDQVFSKSSNSFAAELYQVSYYHYFKKLIFDLCNDIITFVQKKTIEGKTGNVIISPISVQSATTLAMFGATGKTKQEMMRGLKYPETYSDDSIAKNFQSFSDAVRKTNGLSIGIYLQYLCGRFRFVLNFNYLLSHLF